ncbi:MAG: folate family ECF transporter S component [Ruminococcaceae bacterium]|nr:folate family ECF transporter S component [Oscillospiraceae bacterium]
MRKSTNPAMKTRTLVTCALLAAITVVLARLVIPMPNATTRFSIEAVPVFLAGMLFGPIPGMLVGFAADAVGCLFSGYGYNPLFCVPPLLYGLCGGLFRPLLARKMNIGTIALAFLPAVALGSILYQSWSLAFVYNAKGTFKASFLYFLSTRSAQFAVTFVLDVLIVWALYKCKVFQAAKLWPPQKEAKQNDA